MSDYIYTNNGFVSVDELKHYGVVGMRWGHRKAQGYADKASLSRASAKEWDEMARYKESQGKNRTAAKYRANAARDRADASKLSSKATYTYKSHSTKKYEKKAATAKESAKEWDEMAQYARSKGKGNKAAKYAKYAKEERAAASKYAKRSKRSAEVDKGEQKYAESLSKGRRAAGVLLAGTGVMKAQAQNVAMNKNGNKRTAAALTFIGGRPLSAIRKYKYIRQDER